jgi:D-alanyl-lipoteichoic acid acyltransferase DltB (MBOAT superfamily)
MYQAIDLQNIIHQLIYQKSNPLLFNSGLFLCLFLGFLSVYSFVINKVNLRIAFITIFSIYFYYKSSGWYFILMLGTAVICHYISLFIWLSRNKNKRKLMLILGLVIYLGLLAYFKYTNFFIEIINQFNTQKLVPLKIFLPLGISFYTFELISYTVDVYQRKFKPVSKLIDFSFYISFFPHLVAGPIVRPNELMPQLRSKIIISNEFIGKGIFLIVAGLIKKAIISDYIGVNFVDRIFDNPTLYSGLENLMGVYGYTLQIYCDFSGYSDMAMGIALLMGFTLPLNFNSPYKSTSITEFWRKWHISLSSWLRDYLYIPLGGNRAGKAKQYINLMITMLLGGLWHGASLKFILWGGLHGVALSLDKLRADFFKKHDIKIGKSIGFKAFGWFITFNFVAFCWIFFRAPNFDTGISTVEQIFSNFNGNLFYQLVVGYPVVFALITTGFLVHFLPAWVRIKTEQLMIKSPAVLQAFILALIIWVVYQTKTADVQPFIYFQF